MPDTLDDSFLFGEQDNTVGSTTDFNQDSLDDSFLFEAEKPEKGIISSAMETVSGVADAAVDTVQAIPKYVSGFFEGGGAAIENRRGIASKINASLESAQVGIASGLSQASKGLNDFFGYKGKDELTSALDSYVKDNSARVTKRLDTAIKNLQTEESKQKLTPEGEFFREAGTSALESTGSMLAGGAAKSVATGIIAMAPQVFGQSYNELKKEGEGEKGAVLHGAAKTAIELASEILPLKKLFNLPEGVVRKIADMTMVEGGTEMASSIGDSLYDASIRGKDLDWSKEWDKAVKSFQLGAAAGGMIGSVAAVPEAVAKTAEGVIDTAKTLKDTASKTAETFGKKSDPSTPDQTGQPGELFNPTHKAGGGVDVQVATKNGKIIPDTYIDEQGNSIRDANAVANNPDESVDVTNDVSAVAASIKAEVFGEQDSEILDSASPEIKSDQVIASLEKQNQGVIDSEFSAPTPEPLNQQVIDSQNFEPTQAELNQAEINTQTEVAPVAGQAGLPPEIPVTQQEINQKKIEGYASQGLTDGNVAQKQQQKLQPKKSADVKPIKQLKPKSEKIPGTVDITKADKLKPSEILKYATDKPRLSAQEMTTLTKSIQDKGLTRPAILLKDKKGKVTLEDGHNMTRIADKLGIDVPIKVIEQKKYETDIQVASRVLDAAGKNEPVGETTENIDKVANEQAATSPKNDMPLPTEAQKESGNYKKSHVKVQGLDITIENPKGSKREGIDPSGQKWSVTMPSSYGYIKNTIGADSEQGATGNKIEQLDVYIGDKPDSQEVFIVNQQDPQTGKFDELKVVIGSENIKSAMDIYYGGFSDNTGGSRARSVYQVSMSDFKGIIKSGFGNKEVTKATDILKKISPLQLKKLARKAGAIKEVDKYPKQTALKNNSTLDDVPREIKGKALPDDSPVSPLKEKEIDNEAPTNLQDKAQSKNANETKIEEKTQRDNRVSNEVSKQPSDVTDPYRAMQGKEISYDVEVEETGESFKVTVDAGKVMKEIDTRVDALKKLRDCV